METLYFIDPLLPGPEDYSHTDSGRRLNGPLPTNAQLQADYNEYCDLYRDYVAKRAPFFRKPEWIPQAATGRVQGWENLLVFKLQTLGGPLAINEPKYQNMKARTPAIEAQYKALFQDLVAIIDTLANCNYVHNHSSMSRVVALYDYAGQGGVAHDISGSNARWRFPTPGGPQVKRAQLTTTYFGSSGENYVPEQGIVSGPDPCRVWLAEKESLPQGQAEELCLSIGRHPNTVTHYSSLLWAAVRGQ